MSLERYLKGGVWEMLLCIAAASALSYTVCSAFYASLPLQEQPLLIVAGCAVACVALFLAAYNVRTAVFGGIGIAVALAAVFAVLAVQAPGMPLEDVEGNLALAFAMVMLPAVAAFLFSRRKATTVVFIVGGIYLCAIIEYLYWRGLVVALAVFLVAGVALLVYKSYQVTLKRTDAGWVKFSPIAVVALAVALIALALGWLVWTYAIEPLDPPREQVKLIVEYRKAPEIEESGVGGETPEGGSVGGDLANGDEVESDETAMSTPLEMLQGGLLELLGFDVRDRGDEGQTTQLFPPELLALIVTLLVVLAIIAVLASVQVRRRMRFNRLTDGPPDQAMRNLYLYFLAAFAKLRIAKPESVSLSVFAREQAYLLESFEGFGFDSHYESDYASDYENSPDDDYDFAMAARAREEAAKNAASAGAGAGAVAEGGKQAQPAFKSAFEALTDCYTRNVYGDEVPDEDELEQFKQYYWSFFRNARLYIGRARYILKYFTL